MKKNGYLLVELILSALIIAVTGVSISYSFSKEMEATAVSAQYLKALQLGKQKLDDIELTVRINPPDEIQKQFQNQKGSFSDYPGFSWECVMTPHRDFSDLMQINVKISGLKGKRELNLTRWIRYDPLLKTESAGQT